MIDTPTVFVLGAGASQPYGFPLGWELRHEVCMGALHPGDALISMGATPAAVHSCRIALARSWASSIDMFIATRGDSDMLIRQAVALTLCQYEREDNLFFAKSGDWFRYLWAHLVTRNTRDFPTQLVSFITFNYDRSLEHALWNAFEHAYAQRPSDIPNRMPRVIHVYGSLGVYPGLPGGSDRHYGFQPTQQNIRSAASDIKAITDANREEAHLHEARTVLQQAQRIVFLGSAYDETSLALLGFTLKGHSSLSHGCKVFGTAAGLGAGERARAEHCLVNANAFGVVSPTLGANGMDCLEFLRFNRTELFS